MDFAMKDTQTNLSIRIDEGIRIQAEELLSKIGLSLSAAVDMFIRQLIIEGNMPFLAGAYDEESSRYNLPYIRQKLSEADAEFDDPNAERISMDEVMGEYREKYGY